MLHCLLSFFPFSFVEASRARSGFYLGFGGGGANTKQTFKLTDDDDRMSPKPKLPEPKKETDQQLSGIGLLGRIEGGYRIFFGDFYGDLSGYFGFTSDHIEEMKKELLKSKLHVGGVVRFGAYLNNYTNIYLGGGVDGTRYEYGDHGIGLRSRISQEKIVDNRFSPLGVIGIETSLLPRGSKGSLQGYLEAQHIFSLAKQKEVSYDIQPSDRGDGDLKKEGKLKDYIGSYRVVAGIRWFPKARF